MTPIQIRPSKAADMPVIAEIYGYHVHNGLASFELLAPSIDEMTQRRADVISRNFPYLVAEVDGRVAGYAFASLYRARPAYRHTLEDSVYVHKDFTGRGIGRALLDALLEACVKTGARQMIAVIGDSANTASIKLHAACGFKRTGTLKAVGFKFGQWVDSVVMQRTIGEGAKTLPVERETSGGYAAAAALAAAAAANAAGKAATKAPANVAHSAANSAANAVTNAATNAAPSVLVNAANNAAK